MFRLAAANDADPMWIEVLPGVRVQFRTPEPTPLLLAARRAAGMVREAGGTLADAEFAFTAAAACWGALAWEGVGAQPAEGEDPCDEPLPLTPDSLTALMRQSPTAYGAIDADYVTPAILLEQEKNASSPSPNGTLEGAKAIAGNAPASARPARTAKTKPARPKATRSGG